MAEQEAQTEGQVETQATATTPADITGSQAVATFTQADVDRLIKVRLERERDAAKKKQTEKYGDYDALKAAAAELQKIKDADKSEIEKAAGQATKLEAQITELQGQNARLAQERSDALVRSAITAVAITLGFNDPNDAYSLIDLAKVLVDEDTGEITGIEEQLKALGEAKPYLLQAQQGQPRLSATNPGRGQETGETDVERRARLMGIGGSPFGKGQGGGLYMPKT